MGNGIWRISEGNLAGLDEYVDATWYAARKGC